MPLDPKSPTFEGDIAATISQHLERSTFGVLVRQLQGAQARVARGVVATWNWSGSYHTEITVEHGLGDVPAGVIVPGAIRESEMTTDARAPWICAVDPNYTDTEFVVRVMTFNKATIGSFAANEKIPWLAWV